ncbi:MAG TPA: STAS/SEC14 domain-containing protein [Candidatus Thermoplasmatota archaeon]|nr:STAS/SEC14 domain-containing protein [Candidatus Thermoplasmatota archaeon]
MPHEAREGGIIVEHEEPNLVKISFEPGASPGGRHALSVIRGIDARIPLDRPVLFLVDAPVREGFTLLARLEFIDWLRKKPRGCRLAVYNVPSTARSTAETLLVSFPVESRVFRDEASARAWLTSPPSGRA